MSGGDLFERIIADDYKISEAEVIKYISQVCDGIRYMHENNYVHLDIKASMHSSKFYSACTTVTVTLGHKKL